MNSKIDRIRNLAKEIKNNFKYGEIIDIKFFENELQERQKTLQFSIAMQELKNKLIEYGYMLSYTTIGYRVLYPNEIPEEVYKKFVLTSAGKLEKGLKILEHTDRNELSDNELEFLDKFKVIVEDSLVYTKKNIYQQQIMFNNIKLKEIEGKRKDNKYV